MICSSYMEQKTMSTPENPLRDLMDDFNSSMPQADPIFQQQLENRLITSLEQRKQRRKMQSNGHFKTLPLPEQNVNLPYLNPRRVPLMLVATIAIVIGISGVFLWFADQDENDIH